MRRERLDRYPALAASIALHAAAIAIILVLGSLLDRPVYGPVVVPVTLLNSADLNPAPAIKAPTPTPSVEPPAPPTPPQPQPAPPQPAPAPAPVRSAAKTMPAPPKPKAAPVAPTKTPVKPVKTEPDDNAFLSSLSKDLAHGGKPARPKPPSTRPVTGTGNAPSAAALASLSAQLQRMWNPDCDVMGGADVNLTIRFVLGPSGRVIGQPVSSVGASSDAIVKAASDRAIRSVFQAQPISGLNPDHYTVNFNAKQACAQR